MKLATLLALLLASRLCAADIPINIDKDHSSIEVSVKATMDSFTAKLPVYDALITTDSASKQIQNAQVKFRFVDIKTGKDKRDFEMNKWQQTEKFPDCVYVMESLQPGGENNYTAKGKFTLHGVTKELSFPITIGFKADGTCTLDSEFPLNTQDYGLEIFKKFGMLKVDPLLKIKFHLQGRTASSP